jgi:hypothetical protein
VYLRDADLRASLAPPANDCNTAVNPSVLYFTATFLLTEDEPPYSSVRVLGASRRIERMPRQAKFAPPTATLLTATWTTRFYSSASYAEVVESIRGVALSRTFSVIFAVGSVPAWMVWLAFRVNTTVGLL